MFDAGVFRKYDVRGKASSAITPLFAYVLGIALARGFSFRGKKTVIGRDCRLSAESLYDALAAGLLAGGSEPVLLGECPTPCMHFAVETMGIPRGIMVTASHNPAEYIGFKIRGNEGPLCGQDLRLLTAMMEDECVRLPARGRDRAGRTPQCKLPADGSLVYGEAGTEAVEDDADHRSVALAEERKGER